MLSVEDIGQQKYFWVMHERMGMADSEEGVQTSHTNPGLSREGSDCPQSSQSAFAPKSVHHWGLCPTPSRFSTNPEYARMHVTWIVSRKRLSYLCELKR